MAEPHKLKYMAGKFIVKVLKVVDEQTDRVKTVFEQEFDNVDVGSFARFLNKKPENGQEKDEKSVKL